MREKLEPSRVLALPLVTRNNGTIGAPETSESRYTIGKLVTIEILPDQFPGNAVKPFEATVDGKVVSVTSEQISDEHVIYFIDGVAHGAQSVDGGIAAALPKNRTLKNQYSLFPIADNNSADLDDTGAILKAIEDFNARDRRNDIQRVEISTSETRARLGALHAVDPEAEDIRYEDIRVPTALQVAGIAAAIAAAAAIAYLGQMPHRQINRDSHTASAPAKPDQQQPGAQQLAPATAPTEK